jgi:hypothetical protein
MKKLLVIGLLLSFSVSAIEWVKYTNKSSGYSIDYPSDIFDSTSKRVYSEDGLELTTMDDKVKFYVYVEDYLESEDVSIGFIRDYLLGYMYDRIITYSKEDEGGLIFSGYMVDENQEKIFYQRTKVNRRTGIFSTFEIIYPKNQRYIYDQMMERMSFSLTAPE